MTGFDQHTNLDCRAQLDKKKIIFYHRILSGILTIEYGGHKTDGSIEENLSGVIVI